VQHDRAIKLTQREELNVVQLGLISIQRQLPPDYTHWTHQVERAGVLCTVECNGTAKYGVPRGTDNDVYLALQDAYIEQGCPEDGWVELSMYALLQRCGMSDDSGADRKLVRTSLERMSQTGYLIGSAWLVYGEDDWVTVSFNLIEKLMFTRARKDRDGAKLLRVKLPEEVCRNIRDGYFKPVNLEVLRSLEQPARGAYRVLDALRHDPTTMTRNEVLQLGLMDLAARFGIASDEPYKIRERLEPIHQELIERGVLTSVDIVGSRRKQQVTYVFSQVRLDPEPDLRLVTLLTDLAVPRASARRLVLQCPERIEFGVSLARALLASGYTPKNRVGFILDVVRYGEEKYSWPEGHPAARVLPPAAAPARVTAHVSDDAPEEPQTPLSHAELTNAVALLLLGSGLSKTDLSRLPSETLRELKGEAVRRRSPEERADLITSIRAMLTALT
jgi:plasmid replication initiation protein